MFSPLEEDTIYQLFLKGISLSDTINKLKRYPFQVTLAQDRKTLIAPVNFFSFFLRTI
jgi:hypothetical protein